LWEFLAKASGKPVAKVMTSWTKQMGFPVLLVKAEQVFGINRSRQIEHQSTRGGRTGGPGRGETLGPST